MTLKALGLILLVLMPGGSLILLAQALMRYHRRPLPALSA